MERGPQREESPISTDAAGDPHVMHDDPYVPGYPCGDRHSSVAQKPSLGKALETLITLQAVITLKCECVTKKK